MKRNLFYLPMMTFLLFFACSKSEPQSYEYWSKLVNEKYQEINLLVQSVPCTDIEAFQITKMGASYYLVHPSIKTQFDKLQTELQQLEKERGKAASREGILSDSYMLPNPPVRKVCDQGKPKLIYVQNLSIDEINAELPVRYKEIQEFYQDIPCTDPNEWTSYFLRTGCCMEGVAIHKTIRSEEMVAKIELYNRLMEAKMHLEKVHCEGGCPNMAKPVQCKDGKPIVELYKS